MSAFSFSSSSTTGKWPFREASKSGVRPFCIRYNRRNYKEWEEGDYVGRNKIIKEI